MSFSYVTYLQLNSKMWRVSLTSKALKPNIVHTAVSLIQRSDTTYYVINYKLCICMFTSRHWVLSKAM